MFYLAGQQRIVPRLVVVQMLRLRVCGIKFTHPLQKQGCALRLQWFVTEPAEYPLQVGISEGF